MKALHINLSHIITFLHVAESKSYRKAADQLFITQPAVSMQIRAFERQFDIKLFCSKNRTLTLTEVGEKILPLARELYKTAYTCESFLNDIKNIVKGKLQLGVARTLNLFIAHYVSIFRKKFPGVRIVIQEGSSKEILKGLENFAYNIAIVSHYEQNPKIHTEFISEEEMVFVASPIHPLTNKTRVSLKELNGENFILQGEGSGTRMNILKVFEEENIKPNIIAEVDNLQTVKRLVVQNRGISLMYPPLVSEELKNGRVAKISIDKKIPIKVEVAFLEKSLTSPLITAFRDVLKNPATE